MKDALTENDPAIRDLEFDRVLDVLKRFCASEQGRVAVEQTEIRTSEEVIRALQERYQATVTKLDQGNQLNLAGGTMVHLPDFFVSGEYLEPGHLLALSRNYRIFEGIRQFAAGDPILAERVPMEPDLSDWSRRVLACFEPDGTIREDATSELKRLHAAARKAERDAMAGIRREMEKHRDAIMDDVVTRRAGRLVIPIKRDFKGRLECLIHDSSGSGATVFAEPLPVVELNNRVQEARNDIWRAERELLLELSEVVAQHREFLLGINRVIGEFDAWVARYRFAERFQCRIPDLSTGGDCLLRGARHPLLLFTGQDVVPNDVELTESRPVLVVSGSNTGGKTVFLKMVGLLQLMNQAVIPVPVQDGSRFRVFSKIMTDIGDRQSIEESLSTFSSHMMRLKMILEESSRDTLVLVDELGTGTEPSEGAALAVAVTEALSEIGCTVVITSHHYGLARLAEEPGSRVRLAAVSFDEKRLVPTYQLRYDLPGASHAIEIATRIGLPERITRRAGELAGASEEGKAARLSIQLARRLDELNERLQKAETEARAAEALRSRLAIQERELMEERRHLAREYQIRFDGVMKQFRKEREQVFHGVSAKHRKAAKKLEQHMKEAFSQMVGDPGPELNETFPVWQVGQAVRHDLSGMTGTVEEVGKGRLRVRVHGKDLWVAPGDVSPVDTDGSARTHGRPVARRPEGLPEAAMDCNVVGLHVDAAIDRIEKELDGAMLRGLPAVRIIHGHGTGRLRKGIRAYLKESAYVSRYEADTDDGATIVYLK